MGQFAAAIRGMAEACRALDFPVVSGNVSLYNETEGRAILPTPAIGGVGVLEDAAQRGRARARALARPRADRRHQGWLGQSLWLREIAGRRTARRRRSISPPSGRHGDFVREPDRGRPWCAPATMCPTAVCWSRSPRWRWRAAPASRLSAGPPECRVTRFWFGEDQGRYVLAVADAGVADPRPPRGRRAGASARLQWRAGFDTAGRRNHIRHGVACRARALLSRLDGSADRLNGGGQAWRWRPATSRR